MKFGAIVFVVLLFSACIRTPENVLKQQFDITLQGFDYEVETFEDKLGPDGEGHILIVFQFNELTQAHINYFQSQGLKKLPIPEKRILPSHFSCDNGYYLFENESANISDERVLGSFMGNFKLFIVDTDKNKATLYYQYM